MPGPGFAHLTGRAMWERCDHEGTRIDGAPPRVRLSPSAPVAGEAAGAVPDLTPWRWALGSAVVLPCAPDQCEASRVVLADRAGLSLLTSAGWRPMPPPVPAARQADPAVFAPLEPASAPSLPTGVALDPWGRLWLLRPAAGAEAPAHLELIAPDLRVEARVALPPGFEPLAFGCTRSALVAVERGGPRVLVQPWGGRWYAVTGVAPDSEHLSLAADPRFPRAAALVRTGSRVRLMLISRDGLRLWRLPLITRPLHLLWLGEDRLLVGEVSGPPGSARPMAFRAFELGAEGPEAEEGYAVRGFDGRALWLETGPDGETRILASTTQGSRPLFPREPDLAPDGTVETFALDSGIFACVWHRLFVDLCLPTDGSVTIEAKTADDLPPFSLARAPRKPADRGGGPRETDAQDPWPPLGSRIAGDPEGWVPLGLFDARAPYADRPLPPSRIQRPSEDPLADERSKQPAPPEPMRTLEYLITAPPGRYLWLRLRLHGTRRRGPELFALRASFPRPSLLDYLPAYWRADPEGAEATDRALALFEAFTTELDERTDALVHLLDPRLAPAEALPWLATFLALAFDDRVGEAVRRQLLGEIAVLYRQRGTLPGLTRLLGILARAPVQIVEGFRLRRPTAAFLGSSPIGPGLELGGDEGPLGFAGAEGWERALLGEHAALLARRAGEDDPCPPDPLPKPLGEPEPAERLVADPLLGFYRRHAHRFTVIVPLPCDRELEAVLEQAVEAHKPAHTLHRLCWVDAGFRIGRSSLVGIARIGEGAEPAPAVLGEASITAFSTIHRGRADGRYPRFSALDPRGTAL
jgi:phage tail-like protein